MHDFRKPILLAFAALTFFATADAARAQTQPSNATTNAGAPSSTSSSAPAVTPQVQPAFPHGLLPAPQEHDAASREKAEADTARREVQAQEEQGLAQQTQARGYWVDSSTGLMWAGKDNAEDVNWHKATGYCSNLRLAGYSDWRLPAIDELEGIYEWNAQSPGEIPRSGKHEAYFYTFDIKGNIFLTGNPWSSSRIDDNPGHHPEYGWFVYFNQGSRIYERLTDSHSKRALCVRRSEVAPSAPSAAGAQTLTETQKLEDETQARGYWVDPATGLMWAWRDNGRRVRWHQAMRYCRDLRLAGFSDWRLATAQELVGIYDKDAKAPGENPRSPWHDAGVMTSSVKGNLFLTYDRFWSSTPVTDDKGTPSKASFWYFDFQRRSLEAGSEDIAEGDTMQALCVRGSGK